MTQENGQQQRLRGIYLLPNFLTLIGIFAAFYAIIAAMLGKFEYSAIAILVAVLFDGLVLSLFDKAFFTIPIVATDFVA